MNEERDERIREAYGHGYSVRAIADKLGLSKERVWQITHVDKEILAQKRKERRLRQKAREKEIELK